jgi:hypothetical protein
MLISKCDMEEKIDNIHNRITIDSKQCYGIMGDYL